MVCIGEPKGAARALAPLGDQTTPRGSANSNGHCTRGLQRSAGVLMKTVLASRLAVEQGTRVVVVGLAEGAQIGAFRKRETQLPDGVLVLRTLPRCGRITEEHGQTSTSGEHPLPGPPPSRGPTSTTDTSQPVSTRPSAPKRR